MKSKLISLIVLLILSVSVTAQVKNDANKKKTEEVTFIVGMHCSACKAKIEKYIPLERGVVDIKVDIEKKELTVIYKPTKTSVEKLKKSIVELGYSCEEKQIAKDKI
jgi:periplasmic mercuric ion binding protein